MSQISSHLIKVGGEGKVVLTIPDMVGRYILIRQTDDNVIISPFNADSDLEIEMLIKNGREATMVGNSSTTPPLA